MKGYYCVVNMATGTESCSSVGSGGKYKTRQFPKIFLHMVNATDARLALIYNMDYMY